MFFEKTSTGISISDYSIEIVSLGGSFEKSKLLGIGRIVLEKGIVDGGKVTDKERLGNALRGLIQNPQFGRIKTNKIIFSFPESRSLSHNFRIPTVLKAKEEIEFIKAHISQKFPYHLKDLYFDYKIKNREIFLTAVPRDTIDEYLEVFKKCKLNTKVLEIESESLSRVFLQGSETEPVLIIDIGAETTNFSLFSGGGLRLGTTIEVAGNNFTQAISEKLAVSIEEAEDLKKEIGLDSEALGGKIFLVLQKELQEIINEIKQIDDYFQSKEGKPIKKIILTGGSSLLNKLPEYLSANVEKSVVIGSPLVKINIDTLKKKEYFKKAELKPIIYVTVIGAALRGFIGDPEKAGINLIKRLK